MSNWESLQPKKNEKKLGFDLAVCAYPLAGI
jgi:hypothetical protein